MDDEENCTAPNITFSVSGKDCSANDSHTLNTSTASNHITVSTAASDISSTHNVCRTAFQVVCVSPSDTTSGGNEMKLNEAVCLQALDDDPICAPADETVSPPIVMTTSTLLHNAIVDNQSRFRVVKIDNGEAVKQRGRWMCLNFPDSAAPSLSIGRAADWLHDDVGYSSGSSVSSSGPSGQNPLLCFLCDSDSPVGVSKAHSEATLQRLSSSDRLYPDHSYSADVAWFVGSDEFMTTSGAKLCVITHNVNGEDVNEDPNESGASAVAIDNKIEQAMDLVKSHLMFAVREEVELLKERINQLVDRNSQLEQENSMLRATASPETLAILSSRQPPMT